jgi:sugar lactone lactonase YvrE
MVLFRCVEFRHGRKVSEMRLVDCDFVLGRIVSYASVLLVGGLLTAGAQAQVTYTGSASTGNFGSQNLGSTSAAVSLPFTVAAGTSVGSIGVLTTGIPNLDFQQADATTCTAATYAASTTCVVNATFDPGGTGLRMGAVVFFSGANNTGTVLARVQLWGNGAATGPILAYTPGRAKTTAIHALQGLTPIRGLAVDAAGNIFFSNDQYFIWKIPADGSANVAIQPVVNGTGLGQPSVQGPEGLAIDGAGDLFICDPANGRIVEVPAGGANPFQVNATVSGQPLAFTPNSIAVDGAGNLYAAVDGGQALAGGVYKIPAGGGEASKLFSGTISGGIVVDGAGNVFFIQGPPGDYFTIGGQYAVYEIPAGGSPKVYYQITTVGAEVPSGLAINSAGDLFYANNTGTVLEVPVGGGAALVAFSTTREAAYWNNFHSLATDSSGNLFMTDPQNAMILESQPSQPPVYDSYPDWRSPDQSYQYPTLYVGNVGAGTLTMSAPQYPADFQPVPGDSNPCSGSTSLSAGQVCDIAIQFLTHQYGAFTENVRLNTNASNGSAQSIQVTGYSLLPPKMISPTIFSDPLGPNVTFTWAPGQGIHAYALRLGANPGGNNFFQSPSISGIPSVTVTNLPAATNIFARLSFKAGAKWFYNDYNYATAEDGTARLLSPTPYGPLPGASTVTFLWSPAPGATAFSLRLGTNGFGSYTLYKSPTFPAGTTSVTVSGLPTDGKTTVYAQLAYKLNGTWHYGNTSYTEGAIPAELVSPTPGQALPGPNPTFTWTPGQDVELYNIRIGTGGFGSYDLYRSPNLPAGTTSFSATGLPTNRTVYVQVASDIHGVWHYQEYSYPAP